MTVESQNGPAMVRTVQEIRAGRATITVTVDAPVPLGGQEDRVYTQAEVDQYQANEEMHLNQIGKLRNQVAGYDRDRHTEQSRADELDRRLSTSLERVAELERALARSIDRENKLEADGAEERENHRQSLAARDSLLGAATRRIENAKVLLSTPGVTGALNRAVRDQRESGFLAQAIEKALDTLG